MTDVQAAEAEQVWYTRVGKKYHVDRDCRHLANNGGTPKTGDRWQIRITRDICQACADGDEL